MSWVKFQVHMVKRKGSFPNLFSDLYMHSLAHAHTHQIKVSKCNFQNTKFLHKVHTCYGYIGDGRVSNLERLTALFQRFISTFYERYWKHERTMFAGCTLDIYRHHNFWFLKGLYSIIILHIYFLTLSTVQLAKMNSSFQNQEYALTLINGVKSNENHVAPYILFKFYF